MTRANKPPYPAYSDRRTRAKTRPHAPHEKHPAGTKNVLRWFKAHNKEHAKTVEEAWVWYRRFHADEDAAVRKRDAEKKAARKQPPRMAA